MKTYPEIREALRELSYGQREDLMLWMQAINDRELAVEEAAIEYGAQPQSGRMSVDEYLAFERDSQIKYEYVNGDVFAMTGASLRHNIIAANLLAAFHAHLRESPCRAVSADMKVHIRTENGNAFYYPDVVVVCESAGVEQRDIENPKLVVEVLSPSTQRIDRIEKAQNYHRILALEEYLMVAQHRHEVTIQRRSEDWQPRVVVGADTSLYVRSLDLALSLAQIYEKVF